MFKRSDIGRKAIETSIRFNSSDIERRHVVRDRDHELVYPKALKRLHSILNRLCSSLQERYMGCTRRYKNAEKQPETIHLSVAAGKNTIYMLKAHLSTGLLIS